VWEVGQSWDLFHRLSVVPHGLGLRNEEINERRFVETKKIVEKHEKLFHAPQEKNETESLGMVERWPKKRIPQGREYSVLGLR